MKEQSKNNKTLLIIMLGLIIILLALVTIYFFQDNKSSNTESNQTEEPAPPIKEPGVNDEEKVDQDTPVNDADEEEPNGEEPLTIEELSDIILHALDEQDMAVIAPYVHPEKGLTFSPYVFIEEDSIVFSQEDVAGMLNSDEVFIWGHYDGEGSPIETTAREYFGEFLGVEPFLHADEILIDDPQDRGNAVNNVMDIFPDARIIEYYNDGTEEYAGMDWESIILVYEQDDTGDLKIVAIVRDMWTI